MLDAVIEFDKMHAGYDEDIFRRIQCPVVMLVADPELGGASNEDLAHTKRLLRDGRWIRAEGLGHSMHIGDPKWFIRTVLEAVEDLIFSPASTSTPTK
jgi:pimeloyl-ACP methyl ester carboxylesterase